MFYCLKTFVFEKFILWLCSLSFSHFRCFVNWIDELKREYNSITSLHQQNMTNTIYIWKARLGSGATYTINKSKEEKQIRLYDILCKLGKQSRKGGERPPKLFFWNKNFYQNSLCISYPEKKMFADNLLFILFWTRCVKHIMSFINIIILSPTCAIFDSCQNNYFFRIILLYYYKYIV